MNIDVYGTLIAASLVLLPGNRLVAALPLLHRWPLPEPVAGGLVAALVMPGLHSFARIDVRFGVTLQTPLMLAFFATIGLNANLANLKAGGPALVRFLLVAGGVLGASFLVLEWIAIALYSLAGMYLGRWLTHATVRRWFNRGCGAFLGLIGVSFLLVRRA